MKIIIAHNLYQPFARGGAEQFSQELVDTLVALGHEVAVLTTKPRGARVADTEQIKYLPSLYYHLAEVPKALRLVWHWYNVRNRQTEKKLSNWSFAREADLIITNNLQGLGLSFASALQKQGKKWVHIIHDLQLLHPSGLVNYGQEFVLAKSAASQYQNLVKKYLGEPDLVISPSKWILDWHRQYGFFEQSLAMVLAHPYPRRQMLPRQVTADCQFLYLGQVEEHKGVILLLEAFKNFCQQSKVKAQLTIAGEGTVLNLLKLNYQNLPVNFVGRLPAPGVANLLAQTSCLVVPSLCYENWPTVIIEAALAQTPVIASELGGNKELIHNQEYLFVPTVEALTAKLLWMATNRQVVTAPVLPELLSGEDYIKKILEIIATK
jgi:glycosyltransferase involved in cell wall biosynthesis